MKLKMNQKRKPKTLIAIELQLSLSVTLYKRTYSTKSLRMNNILSMMKIRLQLIRSQKKRKVRPNLQKLKISKKISQLRNHNNRRILLLNENLINRVATTIQSQQNLLKIGRKLKLLIRNNKMEKYMSQNRMRGLSNQAI